MLETPDVPRDRLVWVKLPNQSVFWPACVYDNYNTAVTHKHDLMAYRTVRSVLDKNERVVFFFGVRHAIAPTEGNGIDGIAEQATILPNLRFVIVDAADMETHVWEGAGDFGHVCRTYGVDHATITRVEQNSGFLRACSEATRFYAEAHCTEDAGRLFMDFFTGAKTRGNAQHMRATLAAAGPKANKVVVAATPREAETTAKLRAPVKKKEVTTVTPTRSLKLTAELTTLCWSLMEADGWSTFVKPDGSKLYAMPGVRFFEFRPNETVFEALDNACIKFLQVWTERRGADDSRNDQLQDCFWNMMITSGWQTIKSADQVMFVMPNTPFDRFIPNETIFQTKQMAITKFLMSLGVHEQPHSAQSDRSDAQGSDATSSSESETEHETSEADDEQTSDVEMSDVETDAHADQRSAYEDGSDSDDVDDDEDDRVAPRQTARQAHLNKTRHLSMNPTRRRPMKIQHVIAPPPPFKLKQGQVEQELRERGWYWKAVPTRKSDDGFMFYKPHCESKEESDLRVGQDCFPGYLRLETYLKEFEPEVILKLRHDHEAAYGRSYDREAGPTKSTRKRVVQATHQRNVGVIEISDDDADSKTRHASSRKQPSGSAARRKPARDKVVQLPTPSFSQQAIKFGDVWRKLAEKGWYYRPGPFEYDYFKPTGKKKNDLVRGDDFFSSKTELEEYLKTSGLWHDIADEIRRDAELDEAVVEQVTPVKRKQSNTDSVADADTPVQKKVKVDSHGRADFLTPPPTDRVKKTTASGEQSSIEATQDLTALIDQNSLISPESTSSKSRKEEVIPDSSQLARNLNNIFTPSPSGEKATKTKELKLSRSELARKSIANLSLAHQPPTFSHRGSEANKILDFCRGCFAEQRGGSLYLSGSPGCGKSALLRFLSDPIGQLHEQHGNSAGSIAPVHVNAMGMKDFDQLFCQVAESLTNKEFTDGDEAFEAIERGTKTGLKRSKTLLLVLDEIDALGKTSMEGELCRLFELAHRPGHSFILVGIANQIDFTERHLASLRLQLPNIKPQVVVFKPYSFQTISDILTDRLGGAGTASRIVNAHGVAFIARKVAAQSGDVRLALDICRRVLQQKLSELATSGVEEFGSPISLIDIVKTIKAVLEGKSKSNVSSLPRNLQMILFATTRLVAQANCVVSTSATNDTSSTHKLYRVDDLYECYCDVSHDAGVFKPLTRGEFKVGLETLSSEGMIGANELKKQLLKMLCTPSELLQTFKNDAYFSRLI